MIQDAEGTRRARRTASAADAARRRRGRAGLWAAGAVVAVGAVAAITGFALAGAGWFGAPAAAGVPTVTPTPTVTLPPLTPAEQLLAQADHPGACAVTFTGEGIELHPSLQTDGTLFHRLPIPAHEGAVFAGWYASAGAAASASLAERVNGAHLVDCPDRQLTLHGAWVTPDEFAAADVAVPILMYHQFTALPEGEDHWLRANYAYVGDFEDQMAYLADEGFYLPTWDELEAFIDARLLLPARSVVVTDDDADQTWFDLAVPIVDAHGILSTSFMVTAYRQDPAPSPYVLRRSHTHDMHQAGANGQGLMVNASADEIAADLRTSADVLGVAEVIAYPFGHHDERSKEGVTRAGFTLARTIEHGYVRPGTDKLALPVIRINYGTTLDEFIRAVG